jgi:hypothetical protein
MAGPIPCKRPFKTTDDPAIANGAGGFARAYFLRAIQKTKVIFVCVLAAITYGVVHDEITAQVCVEYFSVAHPPLFHTASPIILGLCWGIAATAGIGIVLGAMLAEVSQSEGLPPYPVLQLCHALLILAATMAVSAFLAGILGFELSRHSLISLPAAFAEVISPTRRDRFMAVWFAHCASYIAGAAGGGLLIFRIWRRRGKPRVLSLVPRTPAAIIRAVILAAIVAYIAYTRCVRF